MVRLRVGAAVVIARLPADLGPEGVPDGVEDVVACFFAVETGTEIVTGLLEAEAFD